MTEVRIKTPIYPTESRKKIKKAINKLFPDIDTKIKEFGDKKQLIGKGDKSNLETFRQKILEQKISDTARSIIKKQYTFSLNKQAATVGKINFQEEAALGIIRVKISGSDELIDWLAPRTEDGKPIS